MSEPQATDGLPVLPLSATLTQTSTSFAPILFSGPLEESLERIAEIGFRAVELHVRDPEDLDLQRLRNTAKPLGLSISSLGTGLSYVEDRLSFTSEDEDIRRLAVDRVKKLIRTFASERPLVIIGTIKGKLSEARTPEVGIARIQKSLTDICSYAQQHGMTIVLESICRYEQDYLNTLEEVARFISRLDVPNLKAHIDSFHMNIEEASIENVVSQYQTHIGHVHVADSNRRYPGAGHVDFQSLVRALLKTSYRGYLGLECLPWPDPVTAARRAYTYMSVLQDILSSS